MKTIKYLFAISLVTCVCACGKSSTGQMQEEDSTTITIGSVLEKSATSVKGSNVEKSPKQGWGTCQWTGCKCPGFRPGGASGDKCSNCGHMGFNHN